MVDTIVYKYNSRTCKQCRIKKPYIFKSFKVNREKYKMKIYVDLEGHRWSGQKCPQCHSKKSVSTAKERTLRLREYYDQKLKELGKEAIDLRQRKPPETLHSTPVGSGMHSSNGTFELLSGKCNQIFMAR